MAVVEALLDLLDDQEHDVRASACISLAKSKAGDMEMKIERLMRCLRDSDRFVRESACVALGYLRADSAVPALLQIWYVKEGRVFFYTPDITNYADSLDPRQLVVLKIANPPSYYPKKAPKMLFHFQVPNCEYKC